MRTKGYVRVDAIQDYTEYFGAGLVGSTGVQYSASIPCGTTATAVLNQLVDPGFSMSLKKLKVNLEHSFTEIADAVGSITYYWQARPEYINPQGTRVVGTYINLTGTYTIGVGSLATITGTLTGYVPVGSVSNAPVRIRLMAEGLVGSSFTGKISNSSYVQILGVVIP